MSKKIISTIDDETYARLDRYGRITLVQKEDLYKDDLVFERTALPTIQEAEYEESEYEESEYEESEYEESEYEEYEDKRGNTPRDYENRPVTPPQERQQKLKALSEEWNRANQGLSASTNATSCTSLSAKEEKDKTP